MSRSETRAARGGTGGGTKGAAGGATVRRGGMARAVSSTAATKVLVMGLSGLIGIFTSRMIITHFGTEAYAQYGLLTTLSTLLPFADLGMAAVVINAIAGSSDPRTDPVVRRTITTAMRILIGAGLVIAGVALVITLLGWWPTLLGAGLTPGSGSIAAFLCLAIFGLTLPLTVGQRILVGLDRTTTQTATQFIVAPFMFLSVAVLVLLAVPADSYLAVFSYIASGLVSVLCLVLAARALRPQVGAAIRAVPRVRREPNVAAFGLAWPMLAQMLALPIAMQTDRLLLSHLTHGTELAQYNLATQLYGMVLQTIAAAGVAFWPVFARARSASRVESPYRPTLVFTGGALVASLLLTAVLPWVTQFVSSGKLTLDGWLVGGYIAFIVVQAAKYPIGMYMTDQRGLTFQVLPIVILVPINLGLSWWLTLTIGAGGPIIGSAVAVLLCQVIPNLWYVRRDLARRRAQAGAGAAGGGARIDG